MISDGLLALVVTLLISPVIIGCLRRMQVLDVPSQRSLHSSPTLRGGGIAVALGATTALLFSDSFSLRSDRLGLAVATITFALVGLVEDVAGIKPLRRLLLQAVATVGVLPWLLHALEGAVAWQYLFGFGVLVWVVGYVNAYNFMDGINGMAAVQAIVAGVAWYLVSEKYPVGSLAAGGAVVAGAALGFAPFNFPRARVFLGDVGSYFLGAWLAVVAVVGLRARVPPEAVLAPLALYGVDTATTLFRRVVAHEPWYLPHREHIYQRLVSGGWSHERTTLVVGAVMAACAALGSVSLTRSWPLRIAADLLLALLLVAYTLSPTWLARWRVSRRPQPVPG